MIEDSRQFVAAVGSNLSIRLGRSIHYLEIGVCEGGSALEVMKGGCVSYAVLVDTWGKEYGGANHGSPAKAMQTLGDFVSRCLFITGSSHSVLPSLSGQFDLVFVDGDHSPEGCVLDMVDANRLLNKTGSMIIDDTCHPEHPYIKGLVEKFAADHGFRVAHRDDIHMGVAALHRL